MPKVFPQITLQYCYEILSLIIHQILHTVPSCKLKAQKLNNQTRITFAMFGSRMRLASFTSWHVTQSRVIFFALCKHLYFFGTMSMRTISSYFQREMDKIIDEAKEKLKTNFTRRKMTLDFWIWNLAISRRKIKLTFTCLCTFFVGLKQPQHWF